jgi:hypothetical protein
MSVIDKDTGWKDLKKRLKEFKETGIKVGIQNNAGLNDEGISIAEYGTANEYGTKQSGGNIPPRPFIRGAADKHKNWQTPIEQAYYDVIEGKKAPLAALALVGRVAVDDIKAYITDLKIPKNADSTKKKKKSDNPLIDTGLMRNSIRYQFTRLNK